MSTSSARSRIRHEAGFTLAELLIGMSLTVLLVMGISPLLLSVEAGGVREADRTVVMLQGRVAACRLQRDLRMATAHGCAFASATTILQAMPKEIVFLGRVDGVEALCLVEWEVVGSSLMRRWGPCPDARPTTFSNAQYLDHKTMLEGLAEDTHFVYSLASGTRLDAVSSDDLSFIDKVGLHGSGRDRHGVWPWALCAEARVGL